MIASPAPVNSRSLGNLARSARLPGHPPGFRCTPPSGRLASSRAARRHQAELAPVPIYHPGDVASIRKLLAGFDEDSDGGRALDTPQTVLRQVSRCRIVVTGSYHAAVFALSQGISVVGMERSLHYATKLRGLAAQFGTGCEIVSLEEPDLDRALARTIEAAWEKADDVRPRLLDAAREQIEAARAAYHRIPQIVEDGPR